MKYSFLKGLLKGVQSILIVCIAMLGATAFGDVEIWSLLEQHLKPVVGGTTIAGALTMILNFIKVKRKTI